MYQRVARSISMSFSMACAHIVRTVTALPHTTGCQWPPSQGTSSTTTSRRHEQSGSALRPDCIPIIDIRKLNTS